MKKTILVLVGTAFLFTACNNNSASTEATESTENTTATEETAAPVEDSNVAVVTLNGDDNMKFDLSEIKVKSGQTVKLTLHHVGKAPASAMGHNFVLLNQGVDMAAFAAAAVNAKDNDYIPADKANEVIAHTSTIGGGETTEVEFAAPAVGTYDFLCSFPGHYAMMKGKFIVE